MAMTMRDGFSNAVVLALAAGLAGSACAAMPAHHAAPASHAEQAEAVAGEAVVLSFGPGSAMLSTPMRQRVDALARRLLAEPSLRLVVEGSADAAEADAPALAARRADVVRRWLVSSGIDASRIDVGQAVVAQADGRQATLRLVGR